MRFLVLLCALFSSGLARAETFLDDRSSPESLIRSLYNAVNLHQYGRAFDYFAEAPAKDFTTYAKGFEGTEHVDVLVGTAGGDGAAGSVFYSLPTAIRSKNADGKYSYYAGCYTVRAINADQDPPTRPLQIQSHKLKPIKADDYATYALPKCSEVPAPETTLPTAQAELIAKVKTLFVNDAAGQCDKINDTQGGLNEPELSAISYKMAGDDANTPRHHATIFRLVCTTAAYNETSIFYLADETDGIKRLAFAEPQFKYTYADADSAKLKTMIFIGFSSASELINAEFDPKTNTISSLAKWRGLGDAASSGTWAFNEGQFILKDYDIDPTYDEKHNPMSIIKNGKYVFKF